MSKGIRASRRKLTGLGQNQAPSRYLRLKSPPWVTSVALALQGNALQRGGMWTAAGIFKDPPKDS